MVGSSGAEVRRIIPMPAVTTSKLVGTPRVTLTPARAASRNKSLALSDPAARTSPSATAIEPLTAHNTTVPAIPSQRFSVIVPYAPQSRGSISSVRHYRCRSSHPRYRSPMLLPLHLSPILHFGDALRCSGIYVHVLGMVRVLPRFLPGQNNPST